MRQDWIRVRDRDGNSTRVFGPRFRPNSFDHKTPRKPSPGSILASSTPLCRTYTAHSHAQSVPVIPARWTTRSRTAGSRPTRDSPSKRAWSVGSSESWLVLHAKGEVVVGEVLPWVLGLLGRRRLLVIVLVVAVALSCCGSGCCGPASPTPTPTAAPFPGRCGCRRPASPAPAPAATPTPATPTSSTPVPAAAATLARPVEQGQRQAPWQQLG